MIILTKEKQKLLKNILENTQLYYINNAITKDEYIKIINFVFDNLKQIKYISRLDLTQIINLL